MWWHPKTLPVSLGTRKHTVKSWLPACKRRSPPLTQAYTEHDADVLVGAVGPYVYRARGLCTAAGRRTGCLEATRTKEHWQPEPKKFKLIVRLPQVHWADNIVSNCPLGLRQRLTSELNINGLVRHRGLFQDNSSSRVPKEKRLRS